ncbi:MAG: response regulator transcription factor [Ignavibacteriae bacterium]|nr:response regulator transcription factor [Ignavibacteriota bacterium]
MTIMIVDDNERIRHVIRNLLSSVTTSFYECENGVEAVHAYANVAPDWVLMDIQMEGIDGITATKQIMEQDPDANVIIVTGYGDTAFRNAATKAGAKGFILKENIVEITKLLQPN